MHAATPISAITNRAARLAPSRRASRAVTSRRWSAAAMLSLAAAMTCTSDLHAHDRFWTMNAAHDTATPDEPSSSGRADRQSSWPEDAVSDWTLRIQPVIWYGAISGDFTLPGDDGSRAQRFSSFNLDKPRLTPMNEVHLRKDDWTFSIAAFHYNIEGTSQAEFGSQVGPVTFGPGDTVYADMRIIGGRALAAYRFQKWAGARNGDGRPQIESGIEVLFGARVSYTDFEFSATPAGGGEEQHTSAARLFAEPVAGIRWQMEMYEQLTVDVMSTFGGITTGRQRTSISWDIMAGTTWRPVENLGFRAGYRQLLVDLQDDGGNGRFEYKGAIAGLYAGLEIRF